MKLQILVLAVIIATFQGRLVLAGGPMSDEVVKMEIPGIENFSRLTGASGYGGPVVGFGGATQASAFVALKDAGFASVINLRLASEDRVDVRAGRTAAEQLGLQYVHLPLDSDTVSPAVIESFLATVSNRDNQPVYIHCGSATRAAAVWMIGRVLQDGWDIDAASAEAELIALKPEQAIAFAKAYLAADGS